MNVKLEVNIGGLVMKNPVTVGSGTFAYGQEYDAYFDVSQLGAVTTKSLSLKPRAGNRPPRLVETPAGMLNAIGLQNVGIDAYLRDKMPFLREKGCTIIANIYGHGPDEYVELARRIEVEGGGDAIEANLSCPNVHDARSARGCTLVAQIPDQVAEYTRAIRSATKLPLFIKLTPNIVDIAEPCLAAQEAGADAVSLINTLLGLAIDRKSRRPILSNNTGGLSGPAIKPVALRMVAEVSRAVPLPVIGAGGIMSGQDAIEFLIAGARAVEIGTATLVRPTACCDILDEMIQIAAEDGSGSLADYCGTLEFW